jgi:hypothetical protein
MRKRTSPHHIIVKMPRLENKERILKASRKKCQITKVNTSELVQISQQKPPKPGKHRIVYFKL